jgi:DNA-binding beta-propeller fold protein YncE
MTRTRIRSMFRLAPIVLAGLVAAGSAWAAYPGMGTTRSAVSPDGKLRYETDARKGRTTLDALREGRRVHTASLRGLYGFPLPTNDSNEGVSHDGRTLVLAGLGSLGRFAVLDAGSLRIRRNLTLRGQFTYDALSPNARTLYLIQHVSPPDRYYVRAYDLTRGRLLKQIVFDTREKSVMRGSPVSRATGPSGRWVYTLYGRSNGTLFVHALDTVDRHAVCIDLPRRVTQDAMQHLRLKLTPGVLSVRNGTSKVAVIDTKTLRLTRR